MEKRAMAVREEQWIQTIAAAKQSGQPINEPFPQKRTENRIKKLNKM